MKKAGFLLILTLALAACGGEGGNSAGGGLMIPGERPVGPAR